MATYRAGTRVKWKWGTGWAEAKVVSAHRETTTRTLKGEEITRHGTEDNPAYVLEQDDGARVLKLHSELSRE
ncbi:DUF2945 domain-containing protein [Actinokineospora globicatena]|uniref:Hypervirulence associated protein TUDOR domain-containing protein n=1 Tax=Actinokineospora globicatena TaxID=103729 RepID=A0A9W6QUU4_9PSEU|nr:DUF2945 domain-containing protein [Actinokineospora globicatena]MCP2301006.1 hypothetical protein [Actinokineospora globicatena]GLW77361.1 hypothetical protein Aglo01_18430 [Actinokineospora globicatena]GLW84195.1 hypothetical protein Aglo02_18350 [Actinokineospora globicatena]GLW95473.1 hypothetical protein Aglo03_62890 [Actinokineospora globicatena]